MKTKLLALIISALSILLLCSANDNGFIQFQNNADIIRLRHLKYYNDLIEEYQAKTGKYPYQSSDPATPTYIFIANRDQLQYTKPGPPFSHHEVPFKAFIQELEKGLSREIVEFYDPQPKPNKKPNFYIYTVRGNTYYLAVNLHNSYPFTHQITSGYNKVELSNHPTAENKAVLPRRLFNNAVYKEEVAKEVEKPGFFMEIEKKYIRDTKEAKIQ